MNSIIIAMMHKYKQTHTKPQRTSHLIELRQVRSNISQVIHQTGIQNIQNIQNNILSLCMHFHFGFSLQCRDIS